MVGCATFKSQTQIQKDAKQTFVEFEDFGIRTKPILNREYIIFLCWYLDVYGQTYPEKVLEILLFNTPKIPDLTLLQIGEALTQPDTIFHPILKSYILQPKFIDYPLIGLSKHQILEMQKWMGDRYNENLLIDAEYLVPNFLQKDEDCYVIESAVSGQYEGTVWKYWYDDNILPIERWREHPHKPNFRLPYMSELMETKKKIGGDNRLIEYSFGKEDFLWIWSDFSLKTNKITNKIKLNAFFEYGIEKHLPSPLPIDLSGGYPLSEKQLKILTLEKNEKQYNNK